jgi:hypothetical protein
MGDNDVAHFFRPPPALRDDRQDALAAVVVAGFHHGQGGIGLDQVAGGHLRPDHATVDSQYAAFVFQRRYGLAQGHSIQPTKVPGWHMIWLQPVLFTRPCHRIAR